MMRSKLRVLVMASALALTLSACEKAADKAMESPPSASNQDQVDAKAEATGTKDAKAEVSSTVIFDLTGAGPFKLGAKLADVSAQVPLLLDYSSEVEFGQKDARAVGKGCEQLSAKAYPGVQLMFEDGVLTRIDAVGEVAEGLAKPAPMALSIADQQLSPFAETKTSLLKKTGALFTVSPHKYSETGNYLEFMTKDGKTGVIVETEGDAVTQFRVGNIPAVQYVEGCL